MIDTSKGFTLKRIYDASPEQIWAAWTDADQAAQWWHPQGTTTLPDEVAIDARVDGRYTRTVIDDQTGERHLTGGVYREVTRGRRLVFTWGDPTDDPDDAPVVALTIEPAGDLTRLVFDIRGVDGAKGDGDSYDEWESALDELADHLGQTAVHG